MTDDIEMEMLNEQQDFNLSIDISGLIESGLDSREEILDVILDVLKEEYEQRIKRAEELTDFMLEKA